ncbi:hypothetical protein [Colwellia sp. E2M01]|uniref:hypothetical protein n=1 Tax=Colwellia sp. E2M01 TaxID=2841561 RepID=UPI001C082210|nr:hypothetical protein [Colwellia sp. E2M01]MBU2870360.1 hypothetical protein [Colwellia sp. E2M01]
MSTKAEVCLSNCTKTLPSRNTKENNLFLKDNPHIKTVIPKGTPFLLRNNYEDPAWKIALDATPNIMNRLQTIAPREQCTIADINASFGSDMLVAMASLHQDKIKPLLATLNHYAQKESAGLGGAAATAMQSRLDSFGKAVMNHHMALNKLHEGFKAKLPRAEIMRLENTVKSTVKALNQSFQAELTKYFPHSAGRRGTIMTNADRAIGMAKGAKTYQPLNIANGVQFGKVLTFAKAANYVGKGALIVDAGFRVDGVIADKAAGQDWQRRAITETTGFGLGTAAGTFVGGGIITSTLGVALMATPVGWVLVIGAGLTAGYFSAKGADWVGKGIAGKIYDRDASWIPF